MFPQKFRLLRSYSVFKRAFKHNIYSVTYHWYEAMRRQ